MHELITPDWQEIALRLALTAAAGSAIGFNRQERARPAGLRTVLLVSLAAAVGMIQANIWMGLTGKPPGSFVTLDPMRLPLGILSGWVSSARLLLCGETISF
jgi:putative Mg2+ transporter-C (MgtC) family protein